MWMPSNLKLPILLLCSVDMDRGRLTYLSLPVVHKHPLYFTDVQGEVVVWAPSSHSSDLLSVGLFISIQNKAYNGGVFSKIKDAIWAVLCYTVMCKQAIQMVADHTALGCSCAEGERRGCEDSVHLWPTHPKKARIQMCRWLFRPRSFSLVISCFRIMKLNAELYLTNSILT